MKLYKKLFISLVCVISLILSMISVPVAAADTNSITATTNATVKQGASAYCYVSIDSTEGLAALDVTVHYDPAKVKITGVYNSISCTLYDSVTNTDNLQFSYIMDGQGKTTKTRIFYFTYKVLNNAEVGESYFDITVGEAYDSSLNAMAVSGSRCKFSISETVSNKSCSVYGSSQVSTSIEQEFTLSYQFSTYQIAGGTAVITYDSELFEVVEVQNGAFLTDKVVDINTNLTGEIYISFVGTEYYSNTKFVSVTFRTIKNVADESKIILKTTELFDKELNPISSNGYTTNMSVIYDNEYIGDTPAMKLEGTFSCENNKITLEVLLEENSHLGAGDFVIKFNPEVVAYNSCTKGFSPTFFNINDKNVGEGELKFHIISLSDIMTEEKVLTIVFDVKEPYDSEKTDFTLEGTGLTDSLTDEILLNFIDESVWMEYMITFCDSDGSILQSGMYHYGDIVQEPEAPTKESDDYGSYTFIGWDKQITTCTSDVIYTAVYDVHPFDEDTEDKLNGAHKANDGNIYYYTNGEINTGYTGMCVYKSKCIYVNKGKFDITYTGLAKNANGVWYIKNGILDLTYTGMAKNAYGVWYMKNGKLDTTYTGLCVYEGKCIYVNKGKFDTAYTGMAKNANGVWYMKNGKLDTTYTGLCVYEGKCIYVNKGKFDVTYTGLAKNASGVWYMKNGILDLTYNGTVLYGGNTYTVVNGKVII